MNERKESQQIIPFEELPRGTLRDFGNGVLLTLKRIIKNNSERDISAIDGKLDTNSRTAMGIVGQIQGYFTPVESYCLVAYSLHQLFQ